MIGRLRLVFQAVGNIFKDRPLEKFRDSFSTAAALHFGSEWVWQGSPMGSGHQAAAFRLVAAGTLGLV
jgi:hypothetical protein